MKKILKKFKAVGKVNPKITHMPLILVAFGLIGLCISIWGNEIYKNIMYIFLNFLFFFIPLTTLRLVITIKRFTKKERSNILKRMLITCIPGIVGIASYDTWIKEYYLVILSALGALYFLIDFAEQSNLAYMLIRKPKSTINNEDKLFSALATKCSRTVFYESLKYIRDKEIREDFRKRAAKYPFSWINLFPLTKMSLTEKIFGFRY